MTKTPEQWREELYDALRSDKYQKALGVLKGSGDNCYCLLGLMCEISGLGSWVKKEYHGWSYVLSTSDPYDEYSVCRAPIEVLDLFGVQYHRNATTPRHSTGKLRELIPTLSPRRYIAYLSDLSDHDGGRAFPFPKIADVLEEQYKDRHP